MYVAAIVVLNALPGVAVAPRRTLAALRASRGRGSLFSMAVDYESLLDRTVGELREMLDLPRCGLAAGPRGLHGRRAAGVPRRVALAARRRGLSYPARAMSCHAHSSSGDSPAPVDEGALRSHDAGVIRSLVENHSEFLRFLEKKVGRRDVAEDILQDAFVRGIGRVETLKSDDSAVAWFYRTLRNAVIDRYRRRDAEERALEAFARELEEHEEPAEEARGAVCQCVARLAATLKPEYADALERIEVQGVPVKTFAEERGISPSNAGVRIFRAREALRRQVFASCGTCAEHGCVDCTCAPAPAAAEGSSTKDCCGSSS